jgi:predicted dehydrogenase
MSNRIGIIGAGKRVIEIYLPLLSKINVDLVGFYTTNRRGNAKEIESKYNIKHHSSINDLIDNNIDILMIAVPEHAQGSTIDAICQNRNFKGIILVDTPGSSTDVFKMSKEKNVKIGVIEQWPYLPLEQFKNDLIRSGKIGDVTFCENDFRTFDYHGISQIRSYFKHDMPLYVSGHCAHNMMKSGLSDKQTRDEREIWDIFVLNFGNKIALHKFNYEFKRSSTRCPQSIKIYTERGSIVNQSLVEKSNDYETMKISYVDHDGRIKYEDVKITRENDKTLEISTSIHQWSSPNSNLNDHEVGIYKHLEHALRGQVLYTYENALIDYVLFVNARESAQKGGTPVFFKQ